MMSVVGIAQFGQIKAGKSGEIIARCRGGDLEFSTHFSNFYFSEKYKYKFKFKKATLGKRR